MNILKKEVTSIHIIQQIFNGINRQYSWIVKRNQQWFEEGCFDNAKIMLNDVFPILFEKPPDEPMPNDAKNYG